MGNVAVWRSEWAMLPFTEAFYCYSHVTVLVGSLGILSFSALPTRITFSKGRTST